MAKSIDGDVKEILAYVGIIAVILVVCGFCWGIQKDSFTDRCKADNPTNHVESLGRYNDFTCISSDGRILFSN